MERKKNDAITNARLCDANCTVDTDCMNRWVEELPTRYRDAICCNRFQSVFRCMNIENKDVLIGAAGRLIGMRILVPATRFKGNSTFITNLF
jgi:hypothetical protein